LVFGSPSNIWDNLLYLSSAETSQRFLYEKYEKNKVENPTKMSFENCYPFIYYIDQGKSFFTNASNAALNIKPILLFYGLSFLIKACLLTTDPHYPDSSQVLAHGVSTRKRKKQNYSYMEDDIKLQKHGLFPHFSDKMFHMKHLDGTKYTIEMILKEIPELASFLSNWDSTFRKIEVPILGAGKFKLTDEILDTFKMTKDRMLHFLQEKSNAPIHIQKTDLSFDFFIDEKPLEHIELLPFRFDIEDQKYYIFNRVSELSFFNELTIHYLILFHLSMIARYEVEWWSELLYQKPGIEYPLIVRYLTIAEKKVPFLINQYLFSI